LVVIKGEECKKNKIIPHIIILFDIRILKDKDKIHPDERKNIKYFPNIIGTL